MIDIIVAFFCGFTIAYFIYGRRQIVEIRVRFKDQPGEKAFVGECGSAHGMMVPIDSDVCSECREGYSSGCACWCHGERESA